MRRTLICDALVFSSLLPLILINASSQLFAQCPTPKQQQAIAALASRVTFEFGPDHEPTWLRGQIGPRTSEDPVESAISILKTIGDVFCVSPDDGFLFSGRMEKEDKLGQTAVRVIQTYRGLDVVGPELIVHMTRDSVILINGNFVPGISLPTEPVLSAQEASKAALNDIAASGGINGTVKEVRQPLVFVEDGKAHLAYPVQVYYFLKDKSAGGDDVFVEAITGHVLGKRRLMWSSRARETLDGLPPSSSAKLDVTDSVQYFSKALL
jgi:Zn-dependent metalloprotease